MTPKGKKRHPISYGPFLGGRRACLGQVFAENTAKCILSIIASSVDMEFINPEHLVKKPYIHMIL